MVDDGTVKSFEWSFSASVAGVYLWQDRMKVVDFGKASELTPVPPGNPFQTVAWAV
jgi:hypothetical protein